MHNTHEQIRQRWLEQHQFTVLRTNSQEPEPDVLDRQMAMATQSAPEAAHARIDW